ncbi:NrfD/PsrC family molybdoenzyme membrane anchor subunit [Anaeroselena agilis]|uniref:Polysulfide reductase NrfD n=1 Tax=Anaeroselena agilis TaxID=3063788 RepID=A0ABU3P4T5_9FIRM|nr:polysulfide reductase NrfD [Selenomonadales bacterium 4137-cl]
MPKFERWMALPGLLVLAGLAGAGYKLVYGEHALGTTAAVPWGSLIAGYVFFAAAATGVGLVGAAGHYSGRPALAALERPSLFLALSLLLAGFGLIGIELGNPLHMIYIVFSPNLHSGIWWMGLLYSIYMALLVVECYFSQTDPANKNLKFVSALAVVNKVAAVCNLGAIFALVATRPFWHGFYFPLYILLTAILSGAAALAAVMWLSARRRGREADGGVMAALGRIMLAAAAVTLLANAGKVFHGLASGDPALREATAALVNGPLALRFWVLEIGLGLLVPLALLVKPGGGERVFRAAVMVLIGVFFMRLDFVMAGQMVPQVVVAGVQHTLMHAYAPTWTEWALIGGAAGAATLLFAFSEARFDLGAGKTVARGQSLRADASA